MHQTNFGNKAFIYYHIKLSQTNLFHLFQHSFNLKNKRVIGSTSNSEYFSETFNCNINQKNNPARKCQVW
jgi:hypothetical protein